MKKFICLVIPFVFLFFYGCESNVMDPVADDSSTAADLEEAKMALDDGNYDKSIRLMENHYNADNPDPEVARVLSSAYMGKAGVDLTYIIEFSGAGNEQSYDVIANALAHETTADMNKTSKALTAAAVPEYKELQINGPRYIDQETIAGLLTAMSAAKTVLQDLMDYFTENDLLPDDDDTVKLGMASALDFIMTVSEAVVEITGTNAPINSAAYAQVFSTADPNLLLDNLESYLSLHPEITGILIGDLINVKNAIVVMIDIIGTDEDITDDFDQFMRTILGLDNFTPVTDTIIREHLTAPQIVAFVRTELID